MTSRFRPKTANVAGSLLLLALVTTARAAEETKPTVRELAAKTQNEIVQLSTAVTAFKTEYAIGYLPSRIRLRESGKYDENDLLDRTSLDYLKRVWPRLQFPVNWKGHGEPDGDWVLEGDQSLVFFLGGIASAKEGAGPIGFSQRDPHNPAAVGGKRTGPFFEFDPKRLARVGKSPFASYLDTFGKQPYAYFTAAAGNDYYRYAEKYGSDCARLKTWPYAFSLNPLRCVHPTSFQIISAGPDRAFGMGTDPKNEKTSWVPETALTTPEGRDDLSNFHPKPLGLPNRPAK
jgi:hypothetical protein